MFFSQSRNAAIVHDNFSARRTHKRKPTSAAAEFFRVADEKGANRIAVDNFVGEDFCSDGEESVATAAGNCPNGL